MRIAIQWIIATCLVLGAMEVLSSWSVDRDQAYRTIAGVK